MQVKTQIDTSWADAPSTHEKGAVRDEVDVNSAVWNRSNPLDAALWCVIYPYLIRITFVDSNNTFYTMLEG